MKRHEQKRKNTRSSARADGNPVLLIPLAFLSPAIVQAIAEGHHPANLTGEGLSRGINIPVDWAKQYVALGFD